nr:hypothetical protein [Tanacetum cinerariifolium]
GVVLAVAGLWQWGCGVVTGAWPESGRDMVGKRGGAGWGGSGCCHGGAGSGGASVRVVMMGWRCMLLVEGGSYRSGCGKSFWVRRKNFSAAAVRWWPAAAGGWPAVVVAAGWEEGEGVFVCVLIY